MLMRRRGFSRTAVLISPGTVMGARSGLRAQLGAREPAPAPPTPVAIENRMVLVATGDLPAGQFVRPDNLHWQAWPEARIAENYVVEGKGKLEDYVGPVVRSGPANGDPIAGRPGGAPGERWLLSA